jgi:hypothetical protein
VLSDYHPRVKTSWVLALGFSCLACDSGSALPLEVEARENVGARPLEDKIEVLVKTVPGTDLTFQGKTQNIGEAANYSYWIPKSQLNLGKNTFTVDASGGVFLSRKKASATATLDLLPRMFLHFQSPPGVAGEGSFACAGTMCATPSIAFTKEGKMPLAMTSDVAVSVTIEGRKVTLAPGARENVEVDLLAKIAQTPVAEGDKLSLPLAVEANGEKATETLELRGSGLVDLAQRELRKVDQGPVVFAGEAPANKDPDAMVVLGAPSGPLIVVGKPATFGDVDLVGIAAPSEHTFPCPNGAGILYVDTQVKVYARRTGAPVATKNLFADRTTCPPTAATQQLKSAVREDDVKRVLAEVLKK